jgi:putative flippase GtrA
MHPGRVRPTWYHFRRKFVYLHLHMMKTLIARYLDSKFFRFIVVGLISAAIEYSLYFGFTLVIDYQLANVVSFALTNIVTFLLSRKYVFVSNSDNRSEEISLFVLCLCGALVMSQTVLWAFVEYGDINDKIAKGFAICVAVIWNYFTRKHIVFRTREEEVAEPVAVPDPVEDTEK